MPIIPDYNDSIEYIVTTVSIIKEAGINTIHCLLYNNLDNDKLKRIHSSQKVLKSIHHLRKIWKEYRRI